MAVGQPIRKQDRASETIGSGTFFHAQVKYCKLLIWSSSTKNHHFHRSASDNMAMQLEAPLSVAIIVKTTTWTAPAPASAMLLHSQPHAAPLSPWAACWGTFTSSPAPAVGFKQHVFRSQ